MGDSLLVVSQLVSFVFLVLTADRFAGGMAIGLQ